VSRLDEKIDEAQARTSAARVKAELDWLPLCQKAVEFAEQRAASGKL
jgi:hypothetical protein